MEEEDKVYEVEESLGLNHDEGVRDGDPDPVLLAGPV